MNNSGNPEPIGVKFYTVGSDNTLPWKLLASLVKGNQNDPDKPNYFVRETTPPECHLSAADLREIWTQRNQSVINPVRKKLQNFTLKGPLTTKNRLSEPCLSGCLVISLQTN